MGWITVAAYAIAAVAALAVWRRARHSSGECRTMWLAVAGLMAFLCINKQLDLQSLVTDVGRILARRQGWYENRHVLQMWFLVAVVGGSALGATILAIRCPRFWKSHLLLGVGLAFLLTFIAVRAISFHHFDALLGTTWAGVRVNWFLELTGIGLIAMAAVRSSSKLAGSEIP